MEALRKRHAEQNIIGPRPQRQRMDAGDDTSASNDDAVRDLVRDFLQLKVQVGDIASAKCITILFIDEDVKKSMQAAAEKWTSTKPAYVEGTKRELHPLGCAKKVYTLQQLLVCLYELVCKHSALRDVTYAQTVTEAMDMLAKVPMKDLDAAIGSFKPKFSSPMNGRAWAWTLTLTDLIEAKIVEGIRSAMEYFGEHRDEVRIFVAMQRQSEEEKRLWTWIRAQPKKAGRGKGKGKGKGKLKEDDVAMS